MGKKLTSNASMLIISFVAFMLVIAIMFLCIFILTLDDDADTTNQCLSDVCKNGGNCIVDKIGSYRCVCPVGYTGMNCEKSVYPCSQNPCKNNGLCFTTKIRENCTCPVGYTGRICLEPDHIEVVLYSQGFCKINVSCPVSCITVNGSRHNITEPGLSFVILNATAGDEMVTRRFDTHSDPTAWDKITVFLTDLPIEVIILMVFASNGSRLIQEPRTGLALVINNQLPTNLSKVNSWVFAGYKGVLGVGWTTSRKSSPDMAPANVTLSIPVVGAGRNCQQCEATSCIKVIDDFICECTPGFTGSTCSQETSDKCESNSCLNNGTCYIHNSRIRCICPPQYNGTYCEKKL